MLQLTPQLFVCPTNDAIYCTGEDNQFNLAILSQYAPLQKSERCQHSTHTNSRPFLLCGKHACALFCHVVEVLVGEEDVLKFCEFNFVLAIMSPSKVCPQCQACLPKNVLILRTCVRSKRKAEYSLSDQATKRVSVKGH